MSIKQISVFVENKPGALYAMTGVLAQNQVDLRALNLAETKDFGIVRLIVDNVYAAATVLKDAGYVHSVTPVLGEMCIRDRRHPDCRHRAVGGRGRQRGSGAQPHRGQRDGQRLVPDPDPHLGAGIVQRLYRHHHPCLLYTSRCV